LIYSARPASIIVFIAYGDLFVFALLAVTTIKFVRVLVRPRALLGTNHVRRSSSGNFATIATTAAPHHASTIRFVERSAKLFRQLRDIRRNPPRLIFGEQLGR